MIPENIILSEAAQDTVAPSKTYGLDFGKGKVNKTIDGIESVKQAIFKMLGTPRYNHIIYSFNYGAELNSLIGKSPLLVESEATRIIQEALTQDSRIQGIQDITVSISGDSFTATFMVNTIYGEIRYTQEVG